MNREIYKQIIDDVPIYVAVFEVIKIPEWANNTNYVAKGDIVYRDTRYGHTFEKVPTFIRVGPQGELSQIALGPSYLKFIEYRNILEFLL